MRVHFKSEGKHRILEFAGYYEYREIVEAIKRSGFKVDGAIMLEVI